MAWQWDGSSNRYRDSETGRFMTNAQALDLVNESIDAATDAGSTLADLWESGQISPDDFRDAMRQQMKLEGIRQYTMGRGGVAQMASADWGSVGGSLADQYRYLDGMVGEMAVGAVTAGQVRRRVSMYFNSLRELFYRGQARAKGMGFDELPAYPGDGSTQCLTGCRCSWDIQEILDDSGAVIAWECYWRLGAAEEHCPDCLDRSNAWSPLTLEARTLFFRLEESPFARFNQCWRCRRVIEEGGWTFDGLVGGVEGRYHLCHNCRDAITTHSRLERV